MKNITLFLFLFFLITSCQGKKSTDSKEIDIYNFSKGKSSLIENDLASFNGPLDSILDDQDREILLQISPRTVYRMEKEKKLTMGDIVKLSQAGISDEVIIRYVRDTKSKYYMGQYHIKRLQAKGVSQRVVNYLIGTGKK